MVISSQKPVKRKQPEKLRRLGKPKKPASLGQQQIETLYARLAEGRPDPRTELEFRDPFTLLIAVLLSAQATDVSVNKATKGLFAAASTPAAMLALGQAGIEGHIRTIGLWRNKAKHVMELCAILLRDYGGQVPNRHEDLVKLPGVGRKTANVVMNEAFGEATIAVDTHIFRVANRTGLAPEKTPDKVEAALLKVTPEIYRKGAHHWLILHGRYVCIARKPRCWECSLKDLCLFEPKSPSPE